MTLPSARKPIATATRNMTWPSNVAVVTARAGTPRTAATSPAGLILISAIATPWVEVGPRVAPPGAYRARENSGS